MIFKIYIYLIAIIALFSFFIYKYYKFIIKNNLYKNYKMVKIFFYLFLILNSTFSFDKNIDSKLNENLISQILKELNEKLKLDNWESSIF